MVNRFSTDPEEYRLGLPKEAFSDMMEAVEGIPLVQHFIDPKRKYAKDLERDSKGRIIQELPNIHILEDMDFFRERAIYYNKHEKYTDLYPNANPNSEYYRFWKEEERRCVEGYVRESDGEWITGYHYFYLNYSPIMLTVIIGEINDGGALRSERVLSFPDFWDGDYMFYHYIERGEARGEYGTVLKARGKGASFKAGSMPMRNMYFFKDSKSYAMASDTEYLTSDGILNKAWDILDWVNDKTPWGKMLGKDTMMHKKFSYKDMETGAEKGLKSELIGVTLKNNPDKARGKRGKLMEWEEAGSFPNLLKSWKIAQKSLEDGNRVFGYMLAFGTGGDNDSNFMALEELFYSPKGYRVHELPNLFDKNASESTCAFFFPDYLNRADCYDDDGNSDVIKAMGEVAQKRHNIKYGSSDPNALTRAKAEEPWTPQEATAKVTHTVFPIGEIKDCLANIEPNRETFLAEHYVGELVYINAKEVTWRLSGDAYPLRDYPIKEKNTLGAVEIFEMPKKGEGLQPAEGRYIIGVDPVDADTGVSMFNFFVFDLFTDNIVAEYTGRMPTANQNYDLLMRTAFFYNAKINYENNLKGLFAFCDHKNLLYMLMNTPQILKDQEMIRNIGYGNKSKGTPANKAVNAWARKLIADWMLSPFTMPDGSQILNVRRIRSIGLLKEALYWNMDGNFDRISGLGMVMIAREELHKVTQTRKNGPVVEVVDKFLEDNYNNYMGFVPEEKIEENE